MTNISDIWMEFLWSHAVLLSIGTFDEYLDSRINSRTGGIMICYEIVN